MLGFRRRLALCEPVDQLPVPPMLVRLAAGFNQVALDEAARQGFANGVFEESEEEGAAVVEEFYPEPSYDGMTSAQIGTGNDIKLGLADKFIRKAGQFNDTAAVAVTVALRQRHLDAIDGYLSDIVHRWLRKHSKNFASLIRFRVKVTRLV